MDTTGRQRRRNDPAGKAKARPPAVVEANGGTISAASAFPAHQEDRCGRTLDSSSLTSSRLTSSRALAASPALQPISHRRGVPAVPRHAAGDPRQLGMRRNEMEVSSTSATKHDKARAAVTGHLDRRRRPWGSSLPPPASTRRKLVIPPPKPISHRRGVPAVPRHVARVPPWLPGDLLVEILSRLPVKPVHRFKCVSKSWRDLISNPNHRKRLPQALAGFIYVADRDRYYRYPTKFINASGRGPPLVDLAFAFLPDHTSIVVLDCCNGLLLLGSVSGSGSDSPPRDYVVCNPATQKWVALPDSGVTTNFRFSVLAFDPAASSHFHVLSFVGNGAVWIYSSLTGGWSESHEGLEFPIGHVWRVVPNTVFLKGVLHFLVNGLVRAVNLETKEWRTIKLPPYGHLFSFEISYAHFLFGSFLGQSQGCLVYTTVELGNDRKISVWTLEDYGSSRWILKHSLSGLQLLGRHWRPAVFALHPELNMVFYDDCGQNGRKVIKSYGFDRGEFRCVAVVTGGPGDRLLLYVPFFGDMPDVGQSSELN